MAERRKLWAVCNNDEIMVVIDATHLAPDQDIPPIEEWDSFFPSCPVCGSSLAPPDEDPTSIYEDQNWHRKMAGKGVVRRLLETKPEERDVYLEQLRVYYDLEPADA